MPSGNSNWPLPVPEEPKRRTGPNPYRNHTALPDATIKDQDYI